jgi:hypothetical protein
MTVKKRIWLFASVIFILIDTHGFAQSSIDTIRIQKVLVDFAFNSRCTSSSGNYRINGIPTNDSTFRVITERIDSVLEVINRSLGKYFIFVGQNDKVVEEGWWYHEFYSGYYTGYFSNGKLKEEGYYTDLCDSVFSPGQKTGTWKHYNQKGALVKRSVHTPSTQRKNDQSDDFLPPCMCSQKSLYLDRNCTKLPPSKLEHVDTHYYSSAPLRSKSQCNCEIKNDSLFELRFLIEYASQFIDSVFSKNECIEDGIFVIKILEYSPKDTLLSFCISHINTKNRLRETPWADASFTLKNKKVLIIFTYNPEDDILRVSIPRVPLNENYDQYFISSEERMPYRGKYVLRGSRIEAAFIYPYVSVPEVERIW